MTGWNTRGDTGSGVALELSWGPGNGKLNRRGEALTCDTKSFSRFSSRTWHTSPLFSNSWALFNMSFPAGTEETSLATIYQSSILVRAVTACSEERVPRKKAFGGPRKQNYLSWASDSSGWRHRERILLAETKSKCKGPGAGQYSGSSGCSRWPAVLLLCLSLSAWIHWMVSVLGIGHIIEVGVPFLGGELEAR